MRHSIFSVVLASALVVAASARAEGPALGAPGAARRVYSQGTPTWIWAEPKRTERAIGYVRLGQSIAVRGDAAPERGPGCSGGFVPIEPFGYVCLDATATLDGSGRYLTSMQALAPRAGPLPFEYALSNGAPMYRRLPTRAEWEKEERFLGAPGTFAQLSWGNRGHERLAEARAIAPAGATPAFLADGGSVSSAKPLEVVRRQIPLGSMLSYTHAFAHAGRTWLASADGTVVPADRVRPFRVSRFRGVRLGSGVELPLAWIRREPRPQYHRDERGIFVPTGASWPLRSYVALDASVAPVAVAGTRYLATRQRSGGVPLWIREADATLAAHRGKLPWGVTDADSWIEVSLTRGTLTAYEGPRAVYATLISPGAGGVPRAGADPVRNSTTPTGVHRVTFKHRAQTMSPEQGEHRSFWIADVPHTQYFNAPFALHTAYWHEDFGEPMSAGCINLSPLDAEWLFEWTGPRVPPGWAGAAPNKLTGAGTYVAVYR